MKMRAAVIAVAIIASVVVSGGDDWVVVSRAYLPYVAGGAGPFGLQNMSFEDGEGDGPQVYWIRDVNDPRGTLLGPYLGDFQEIRPPLGWGVAWRELVPCEASPAYWSGRPEVNVITRIVDDVRVYDGDGAAKAFNFYRCSVLALFQRTHFEKGEYRFPVMGHAWYSSCDDPYTPWPGIPDKVTGRCRELPNARFVLQVCVDPLAGVNPWADSVVCGDEYEFYGRYGERLYSPWVRTSGGPMTVFLRAVSDLPLMHNDAYFDSVGIETR